MIVLLLPLEGRDYCCVPPESACDIPNSQRGSPTCCAPPHIHTADSIWVPGNLGESTEYGLGNGANRESRSKTPQTIGSLAAVCAKQQLASSGSRCYSRCPHSSSCLSFTKNTFILQTEFCALHSLQIWM